MSVPQGPRAGSQARGRTVAGAFQAALRPRGGRGGAWSLLPLLLAALLAMSACAQNFSRGQAMEAAGRWEEAMLAYRDAVIDDPEDPEYRAALERAYKVVARDNFDRYKAYLAQKAFRKAYHRLRDAARQDPAYEPVQGELAKWDRVLVGGQLDLTFDAAQSSIALAEEITLLVRLNTPNPGETIDAEVDLRTGIFFVEDLVYDRPPELLALYSVNAIGVELVFGRTPTKQFSSKEFRRLVNIRQPVLDEIGGTMNLRTAPESSPVVQHRAPTALEERAEPGIPLANPHYSLRIQGDRILVTVPQPGDQALYTPRFLYMNKSDRRVLVDFGRYEARLTGPGGRWTLRRLPLESRGYLDQLSRNIALQPYFFYREGVFTFAPARAG